MKMLIFILAGIIALSPVSYAQDASKSTIDEQTSVEVTVYNSNLALIKDVRSIGLKKGEGELRFMDVASHIMPETVHVKSLNNQGKFMVLEQNYEYDLMNPGKLLDKYVGKDIKLIRENYYQDTKEIVKARLLSNNNNQPIYKINNEIYLNYSGTQILPKIPENLIAKPTLMWLFKNLSEGENEVEVSYLTSNVNWKADYVLMINKTDTLGDLSGWVTINNKSGAIYRDASLKLVAGSVHRVSKDKVVRKYKHEMLAMSDVGAPQFKEKGFFEYHIYDLQRKTTLKNNQTKQIKLLEAFGFNIEKEFLVFGNKTYYNRQYLEKNPKQPVNVNVIFQNSKENKLGMPLPKGIVRLYKEDDESKLQFIGEDKINHTPKDEKVTLKVGEAFDIVAERKQTDFKQITTRVYESEWEITLKNHKNQDVVISIIEPIHGNWTVISNSHTYKKIGAFTLRFDIGVPKEKEVKLIYRVRVGLQ